MEAATIDGASEGAGVHAHCSAAGQERHGDHRDHRLYRQLEQLSLALIITNSMELGTVQTGLRAMMMMENGVEWNRLMAMSTMVTVPTLVLFVALQKVFVQGITKVGLK